LLFDLLATNIVTSIPVLRKQVSNLKAALAAPPAPSLCVKISIRLYITEIGLISVPGTLRTMEMSLLQITFALD
jgi:hypothetical protein